MSAYSTEMYRLARKLGRHTAATNGRVILAGGGGGAGGVALDETAAIGVVTAPLDAFDAFAEKAVVRLQSMGEDVVPGDAEVGGKGWGAERGWGFRLAHGWAVICLAGLGWGGVGACMHSCPWAQPLLLSPPSCFSPPTFSSKFALTQYTTLRAAHYVLRFPVASALITLQGTPSSTVGAAG